MESLDAAALTEGAVVLVDSAPIIYTLEGHARFAAYFAPLFQRHEDGEIALAVTTVTIAEVLTGPLKAGEEALARRYRRKRRPPARQIRAETARRHPGGQRAVDQCCCTGDARS
jgi:hypothetical protein